MAATKGPGKRRAVDTKVGSGAVGSKSIAVLAALYLLITVILIYSGMAFWPPTQDPCTTAHPCTVVVQANAAASPTPSPAAGAGPDQTQVATIPGSLSTHWFFWDVTLDRERSLLLVVAIGGALGAMAHVLRSFYGYVGERHLVWSWVPSYFIIPMVGALFAIFAYVFLRAGLITGTGTGDGSPFGFTAVAILVGLYTNQAAGKFKQVFETVFTKPEAGSESMDSSSAPTITAIAPTSGSSGDLVVITGTHLEHVTEVAFGGGATAEATWDAAASQLSTHVPDGAISGPLTVSPDEGTASSTQSFEVASAFRIDSVTPPHGPVGTVVAVVGTGFDETMDEIVFADGLPTAATFDPAKRSLSAAVPDGAITGTLSVSNDERTATSTDAFVVDPSPPPTDGDPDPVDPGPAPVGELEGDGGAAGPDPAADGGDAVADADPVAPAISRFSPTSGPVGTLVEVFGTGIGDLDEVDFGDIPSEAAPSAGGALATTVPEGAVDGPLSVTVGDRQIFSSGTFEVTSDA